MGRYFIGVAHPAVKRGMRDPTSTLSYDELSNLVYLFPRIPVTYEHRGIVSAAERMVTHDNLHPELLHETFAALGKENAVKSPVGKVHQATLSPNGAMYTLFEVYPKFKPSIQKLIVNGRMNNLSFSKQETVYENGKKSIQPVELTVCAGPQRLKHCHIIMGSDDMSTLAPYMRKVHKGLVSDVSVNLETSHSRLPIAMSAKEAEQIAEKKATETAPTREAEQTDSSTKKNEYMSVIDKIEDPDVKAKVMKFIASLHKSHLEKNEKQAAIIKGFENDKSVSVNTAILEDYLDDIIQRVGPDVARRFGLSNPKLPEMLNSNNPERIKNAASKLIGAYSYSANASIQVPVGVSSKRARTHEMSNVGSAVESNPVPMDVITSAATMASTVDDAEPDFFSRGLSSLSEWKEP